MRGVTQLGAGFREGRESGHGDGGRGVGVSRLSRGRDMPRQGVRISARALPFDPTHGERLRDGEGPDRTGADPGRTSSPSPGLGDTPRLGAKRWGARPPRLERATGRAET
eukprot:2002539-Pleurochrysis_carterae.AAC.1